MIPSPVASARVRGTGRPTYGFAALGDGGLLTSYGVLGRTGGDGRNYMAGRAWASGSTCLSRPGARRPERANPSTDSPSGEDSTGSPGARLKWPRAPFLSFSIFSPRRPKSALRAFRGPDLFRRPPRRSFRFAARTAFDIRPRKDDKLATAGRDEPAPRTD